MAVVIRIADAVVSEGDGFAELVLSLSEASAQTVSVDWSTETGTASGSLTSDYVHVISGTVAFAPGETTQAIRVAVSNDALAEWIESFTVKLFNPINAALGNTQALATIVDNDTASGTPNVSVSDVVVDEKSGVATFVVKLDRPSTGVVGFEYATVDGNAAAGSDYEAVSGSLSFAAGEMVKTVSVRIHDDATVEGVEQFALMLSSATGDKLLDAAAHIGASDRATVATPVIHVSDAVVSEGDGYAELVLSLSAPSAQTVSVGWSTSAGTASGSLAADYVHVISGTVAFAPGETTQTIRVAITDGSTAESIESLTVNLFDPSHATLGNTQALATIVDNDGVTGTPGASVSDAVVDEKAGVATFVITLDRPSTEAFSVKYATVDGSAKAGSDYEAASGTLGFAAGEVSKTVSVVIHDDATAEGAEKFGLVLGSPGGGTLVDGAGAARIGANDQAAAASPVIRISDAVVVEGEGYAELVISLSAPSAQTVSVGWSTSAGTASGSLASDYVHVIGGTVAFAAGETTQTVRVAITDNATAEFVESFTVNLFDPTNATIVDSQAVVTIVDNDNGINVYRYGFSDDTYTVTAASDMLLEDADGGTDLVRASINYTLGTYVENLTLTGAGALNGTGNALANVIIGNGAANRLSGLGGNDTLSGGAGNDTLIGGLGNDLLIGGTGNDVYGVDSALDVVRETSTAATEIDRVESWVGWTLGANLENLTLMGSAAINGTGNALANTIIGNGAANRLDGGAGADTLIGGAGNDTYVVNSALDKVTEALNAGTDTVLASVSWTLGANLDHLSLTGAAAINGTGNGLANTITGNGAANTLTGAGGSDRLFGGAGNDVLNGGAGNDMLNGGTGADRMAGGAANDTYVVDSLLDKTIETLDAGTDSVLSGISWTLAAHIERLTLTGCNAINGTGNGLDNTLTGNGAANTLNGAGGNDRLFGGAGNDVLNGGTGNDTLNGGMGADRMAGGAGNDTYVVDSLSDRTIETLGAGTDSVLSGISWTLAAHVERLTLTGSNAINGTGNGHDNTLTGNGAANSLRGGAGNDTLSGGAGNDVLTGGAGSDRLSGGAGKDFFHFDGKSGSDTITDFRSVDDSLRFSQATVHIGDGDTRVENATVRNAGGGFSTASEVVVFTPNVAGAITVAKAGALIGAASGNYATGATRLFAVDNGTDSGLFLFTSSGNDAQVSAAELTQLALVQGATTQLSDYIFSA